MQNSKAGSVAARDQSDPIIKSGVSDVHKNNIQYGAELGRSGHFQNLSHSTFMSGSDQFHDAEVRDEGSIKSISS